MKQQNRPARLQLELDFGPKIIGAARHIESSREFWLRQVEKQPGLAFVVGMGRRMSKGYEFDVAAEPSGPPRGTVTEALLECAETALPTYAAHIRNFCHWLAGREARTELTEVAIGVRITHGAEGWCAAPSRTIVRR